MGRYLSIVVLGLSAALSASIIPHAITFLVSLVGNFIPMLEQTRGQLNLVMLFVLCWSVRAEVTESLIWALVGGLALDSLSILPLGATSAVLILFAFFVNSVARQLFRVRILFLAAVTPIATIVLTLYTMFALALTGLNYDFFTVLRLFLIPSILYNLAAVIPVYAVVRLIQRRLEGGLQIAPQSLAPGPNAMAQE
ncbi:MAG: rod shape-determining protein MreD [Anaerolineae bacterium]|nr:rod shape-determining protein MreD [Anaerolineae bacterium]